MQSQPAARSRDGARTAPKPPTKRQIRWFLSGTKAGLIAEQAGLSVRTVQAGIARVKAYQSWLGVELVFGPIPKLEPYYGPAPLVPNGPCQHKSTWCEREHKFVCEQCSRSYYDRHPDFWPDPRHDPAPVGKLPPAIEYELNHDPTLTRRQSRAIIARMKAETYDGSDLGVDVQQIIARLRENLVQSP